jgi:hypothetical protein
MSNSDYDSTSDNGSNDNSSTGRSGLTTKMSEDNGSVSSKRQLAEKETDNVFRLRVLVVLILIVAAACVSMLVFFISKNSEEDEFNTQFDGASEQIVEAFEATSLS